MTKQRQVIITGFGCKRGHCKVWFEAVEHASNIKHAEAKVLASQIATENGTTVDDSYAWALSLK